MVSNKIINEEKSSVSCLSEMPSFTSYFIRMFEFRARKK